MFSFTVITSTPGVLATRLVARGVAKQVLDETGKNQLVGVKPGLEWIEVPNIIVTTAAVGNPEDVGYVPAVMDTRRCFLVKMAHDTHDDQIAGLTQEDTTTDANGDTVVVKRPLLQRTKFGQWVMLNSTADTITSADGRSWPARKVGTDTWLVASDDFGIWQ